MNAMNSPFCEAKLMFWRHNVKLDTVITAILLLFLRRITMAGVSKIPEAWLLTDLR